MESANQLIRSPCGHVRLHTVMSYVFSQDKNTLCLQNRQISRLTCDDPSIAVICLKGENTITCKFVKSVL